jgi:hypothetical protein
MYSYYGLDSSAVCFAGLNQDFDELYREAQVEIYEEKEQWQIHMAKIVSLEDESKAVVEIGGCSTDVVPAVIVSRKRRRKFK